MRAVRDPHRIRAEARVKVLCDRSRRSDRDLGRAHNAPLEPSVQPALEAGWKRLAPGFECPTVAEVGYPCGTRSSEEQTDEVGRLGRRSRDEAVEGLLGDEPAHFEEQGREPQDNADLRYEHFGQEGSRRPFR